MSMVFVLFTGQFDPFPPDLLGVFKKESYASTGLPVEVISPPRIWVKGKDFSSNSRRVSASSNINTKKV